MNEKFCVRLRRERERLKLTQKEFADKMGVSRMSQVNYESGKRYPGEDYFEALKNIGVDEFYLVSGYRINNPSDESIASLLLLRILAELLGLDSKAFNHTLEEMAFLAPAAVDQDDMSVMTVTGSMYLSEVLSSSPQILDAELLTVVLERLETALKKLGSEMNPVKKSQAAVMLYRAFKTSGKIDQKMIEEAIALAGK